MNKDRAATYVFLLVLVLGILAAYLKYDKTIVEMDGISYRFVGMAQLPTEDEIYTPVFKVIKKQKPKP